MADEKDGMQAILAAVDNFLTAHKTWQEADTGPDVPTAAYEQAVISLVRACDGDLPARCREIGTAVGRLTEEWNAYADGTKRSGRQLDKPQSSLWAAVENLQNVRDGASWKIPPIPEPVDYLIASKVSQSQIALYIYAHNGKGPFITTPGNYSPRLVMQEAAEPGSVCKPGWWEALHAQDEETAIKSMRHAIAPPMRLMSDEDEPEFTEDKSSVEELLREGAFPQQIARVKRMTTEEVFRIAKEHGITPNEMGNAPGTPAPERPTPAVLSADSGNGEPHTPSPIPAGGEDTDVINARIIELCQAKKSTPEIAKELGVKVQKVSAVWRAHQAKQRPAPAPAPVVPSDEINDSGDVDSGDQDTIEVGDEEFEEVTA